MKLTRLLGIYRAMKIRWVLDIQYLPESLPKWVLLCCKYPIGFLLLSMFSGAFGCFVIEGYFHGIQFDWISKNYSLSREFFYHDVSLILIFALYASCFVFLYLFWVLAIGKPKGTITKEEALKLAGKDRN